MTLGCSWNKPISIVPCLSWTTASCVFTQGVLSGAIPWNVLVDQYKHFGEDTISELYKLIHSPERSDLFDAGRQLAKQYPILNEKQSNEDNQLLTSESYLKKLSKLNEDKKLKENDNQTNELAKKAEKDNILNFINTTSFNIYDSLNKTLRNSKKNEKQKAAENAANEKNYALNFMVGMMDECTHLNHFDMPVDPQLCKCR